MIFEETEDTLEHVPGSLLSRTASHERFRESVPYKILVVDRQLLHDDFADVSSKSLAEIRGRLLKELDFHQDDDSIAAATHEFVTKEVRRSP